MSSTSRLFDMPGADDQSSMSVTAVTLAFNVSYCHRWCHRRKTRWKPTAATGSTSQALPALLCADSKATVVEIAALGACCWVQARGGAVDAESLIAGSALGGVHASQCKGPTAVSSDCRKSGPAASEPPPPARCTRT
jgi:hypothetical protein